MHCIAEHYHPNTWLLITVLILNHLYFWLLYHSHVHTKEDEMVHGTKDLIGYYYYCL